MISAQIVVTVQLSDDTTAAQFREMHETAADAVAKKHWEAILARPIGAARMKVRKR